MKEVCVEILLNEAKTQNIFNKGNGQKKRAEGKDRGFTDKMKQRKVVLTE